MNCESCFHTLEGKVVRTYHDSEISLRDCFATKLIAVGGIFAFFYFIGSSFLFPVSFECFEIGNDSRQLF